MGGVGRGLAKLILFGEHAAVYGHPAIGVSLAPCLTVRLGNRRLAVWDLAAVAEEDRGQVLAVLARMEVLLPDLAAAARCSVRIESEVPRGVGFGSSAALCTALAMAAIRHAGGSREPGRAWETDRAWELAHDAERLFHGSPSGVDTGLSLLGGLIAFRPRPPGLPDYEVLRRAPLWLVTAAVPRDDACRALIAGLGERMRAGDPAVRDAIAALGRIASDAREALAGGGGAPIIGALAEEAMRELRGVGLSTPGLDSLLAAGKRAGALGGKLSGAGGGGAFFLVADSARAAGEIAQAVQGQAQSAALRLAAPAVTIALQPQRTIA